MFVQITKSGRGPKTYLSYLVRESFRTSKGPRSRTVCNITGLPPELREIIAASLQGRTCLIAEHFQLNSALDFGGLAVLADAWKAFELDRLLAPIRNPRQRGLIQAMIFSRLLFPCAKLALAQRARGTLLPQACGLEAGESFDEDDLYQAMDQFNGRWVPMEKQLFKNAFPQGVSLVLYDLTSVYFEGSGPEHLGKYGHSRDHRSDRPQMILAVATDGQGLPIHLQVLRGNRADMKTLHGLLSSLRRRFGIKEATFVFDGGMSSRLNLAELSAEQLHYVTRLSMSTLKSVLDKQPEDSQLELADRNKILELEHQGKRYVLAGGSWRQQRDQERRDVRIKKAQARLALLAQARRKKPTSPRAMQKLASQAGRMLERLKAHKYFTYEVNEQGELIWALKNELIQAEQRMDGWYLLHTNHNAQDCSSQQVLAHYKGLLDVEEAFCELKSYLEVRPVFHWRPDRVRNHVRICFLAYWLSARLSRQWRALGEKGEVPRILRELQTIRIGQFKITEKEIRSGLTQVPKDLNALLEKLGLLELFGAPPAWAGL